MKDIGKFLGEVKLELSRVIWPKYDEFVGATIVVIFFVAVMMLYLFALDSLLKEAVKFIVGYFAS